ncbi:vomeronasal type-2 receptor 26-like [Pseudophryne corroboree]|uniref:vomeronasal type-2 receptor 26-like n=1 Tax=Pseudophryne corroboree TaxID=495146 RepID=UPI003081E6AC
MLLKAASKRTTRNEGLFGDIDIDVELYYDNVGNDRKEEVRKPGSKVVMEFRGKAMAVVNDSYSKLDRFEEAYTVPWTSDVESVRDGSGDSKSCQKCPEDEWPNEEKDVCVPRILEYLSYNNDIIATVFTAISGVFFLLTVCIFGIFVSFRNSPIVIANNRNLSFILLTSLKLSLLCVHLFIGRPVDITCMLRQISFGIIFAVAVSSVLAKTIMVCIAFKATRPRSSWRKWLGVKLPNSVVFICSSVQVLTSAIWLSVSPPFQEYDRNTYSGVIIIQCNEGSDLGFYFMLGYMGFLAAFSFGLAFMVRTLPDIFNEAKYITFSMLVFCSVWICTIPAYLSSKGKHVVTAEIFAILASGIGVLSCIFFPKCYNILLRPEINRKRHFLKRNESQNCI